MVTCEITFPQRRSCPHHRPGQWCARPWCRISQTWHPVPETSPPVVSDECLYLTCWNMQNQLSTPSAATKQLPLRITRLDKKLLASGRVLLCETSETAEHKKQNDPLTGSKFLNRRMSRHASCSLCRCSSVFGWVTCKLQDSLYDSMMADAIMVTVSLSVRATLHHIRKNSSELPVVLYPPRLHRDWTPQRTLQDRDQHMSEGTFVTDRSFENRAAQVSPGSDNKCQTPGVIRQELFQ